MDKFADIITAVGATPTGLTIVIIGLFIMAYAHGRWKINEKLKVKTRIRLHRLALGWQIAGGVIILIDYILSKL